MQNEELWREDLRMTLDAVTFVTSSGLSDKDGGWRKSLTAVGQKSVPGCKVLSNSGTNMADLHLGLPEPKDL